MSIRFEYVASGLNHTRICNNDLKEDTDTIAYINQCLASLQGKANHDVSFLFNAYTEERLGETLNKMVAKSLANIYSDSGGLQMITCGHKSTDELKRKVYDVQARLSTMAMSFDEIPLVVDGRSGIHDMKSRYFDHELLEEKARLSGKNLRAQVEYFHSRNAWTKPFLILQGNSFETYQEWLDYVVDELGEENLDYVELASGAASLGQGMVEDAKRAFILSKLKYPREFKHLHILGVGSVTRFLPFAALARIGAFDGMTISYDSTTHTMGLSRGLYYASDRFMVLEKHRCANYYAVLTQMNSVLFELGLDMVSDENMFNHICCDKDTRTPFTTYERYMSIFGFLTAQIYNFAHSLDLLFTNNREFTRVAGRAYTPLKALRTCDDANDLREWESAFGQTLESKPVLAKTDLSTLDCFI